MRIIVNIILLLSLLGCDSKEIKLEEPQRLIPQDSMVLILTDMHIIEGSKIGDRVMSDTLKLEDLYQKVYSKFNMSKEVFQENFDYYSSQPKVMNLLFQQTVENLNRIQVPVEKWDSPRDSMPIITNPKAKRSLSKK